MAKILLDTPTNRLQRAKARRRSREKKLKQPKYDGPLYDIEHPSQEHIREECLKLQESWNETDLETHITGRECDQFSVPILSAWWCFDEQEKEQVAIREGRFQRAKKPWYGNQSQEHHDIIYHGENSERLDQPVWWEGI